MKKPEVRSRVCLGNRSSIRAFSPLRPPDSFPGAGRRTHWKRFSEGDGPGIFRKVTGPKLRRSVFFIPDKGSHGDTEVSTRRNAPGGNPGEKEEVPLFQWRGENGSPGEVTRSWAVVDPFSGRGESRNYLEGDSWVPIESSLRLAQSPLSRTASAAPDAIRCTVRWKESLLR